jgi:ribosomal protein L24
LQQHFEPPPWELQIGDHIEVVAGEHMGKHGVVSWFSTGGTRLWFRESNPTLIEEEDPPSIEVAVAFVQLTHLSQTIKYTKERGYDVRPGDVVSVTRGPEYQTKGVVRSVDFPKARLTILSETNHSLVSTIQFHLVISDPQQIDVPIAFVMKFLNAPLNSFDHVIGQEVFVIGGDRKGYRATLYGVGDQSCTVAVHGQARTTLKCEDVVTK